MLIGLANQPVGAPIGLERRPCPPSQDPPSGLGPGRKAGWPRHGRGGDDAPQATRGNRGYAFILLRSVFPDWAEAEDGLRAAIKRSECEADRMAEAAVIDRGGIRLQVRYVVGATASIEIKIYPRSTQI